MSRQAGGSAIGEVILTSAVEEAAARLRAAAESGTPCAPVRELIGAENVDDAYAAQEINTRRRLAAGHRLVGRKIGLTSEAVQRQLGVAQPDFGMLFDDMVSTETETIPYASVMQPRIETEIALVLARPLEREHHSVGDIAGAVAYAVAAFEIVGSRIANWDIKIADTIADNASSGRFVLGARRCRLSDVDLVGCKMSMLRDGTEVSSGSGAACLGSPLIAAVWLADMMVKRGRPLQEGDIILSGALGPMVAARPGNAFEGRIDGFGTVRASFGTV
jgi:2-keto-4-pentenoate hydratase